MIGSTRAVLAMGLGLFGVGCLVGPLLAQQRPDGDVRKVAANTPPPPQQAASKPPPTAVIGTVDIENVFKNYDKFKFQREEFSAAALAKHKELMALQAQGKEEVDKLQKMVPNSVDAKKIENTLTQLKAQIDAGKEQAQRDFALRETEMLIATYKEVHAMVARVAEFKGMTYVLKVSNNPIAATNPDSAMAEMGKTVLYSDPRSDITRDVIHNLNREYKAAGGVAPKEKGTAAAAPDAPAPAPASGAASRPTGR
jgi:Skp family chaperone for outer membrane proteins